MRKNKEICYKYRDGRFLKVSGIGDGDYEIILTRTLSRDCMVDSKWKIEEILGCCEGVYNESGEFISDSLDSQDVFSCDVTIAVGNKI